MNAHGERMRDACYARRGDRQSQRILKWRDAGRSNGRQRPHTETWELAACGKLVVVQPEHPMAQAARCGCYVGTVMIPAHASSMRRAIAQH